ncbi:MAG: glycerophosphodiester phosphodiesterase family protein [Gemmatimonadota bacterium]|nr:glycerophosphodiester phosphodiesterase family protein [Gemmatimonadota bacterium]
MLLAVAAAFAAPLVIGHRGAPGYLPDHTLEGYTLAVRQGADAIEPDLVISRDGVLVARHENELGHTTDVATKFPERKRVATIDGERVEGWFTEDFTLAELKTLRAVQPWPDRPHDHDGRYTIPTFGEVLALADKLGAERGKPVVVVPEWKHPTYFRSLGLPLEPAFFAELERWGGPAEQVILQCFELAPLEAIDTARWPVTRLLLVGAPTSRIPHDARTYGQVLADLPALRRKVEALGVPRELVYTVLGPTRLVTDAHAAGLRVIVWTFRKERPGPPGGGDVVAELRAYYGLGVDGVFADQPDLAVEATRTVPRGGAP